MEIEPIEAPEGWESPKYMKCKECKHEWGLKSTSIYIQCPNCRKAQKNPYAPKP